MAYCIGTVLHSRPSASLRTAATTSSKRGERPIAIQPVRQPGARYAFDRLENEMIGASGSRLPIGGDRTVVAEIAVDLVGEHARPCRSAESSSARRIGAG